MDLGGGGAVHLYESATVLIIFDSQHGGGGGGVRPGVGDKLSFSRGGDGFLRGGVMDC